MAESRDRVLKTVAVEQTDREDVIAVTFTDMEGEATRFLLKPSGLSSLILRAIEIASQWAEHSGTMASHLDEFRNALPAQGIEMIPGRNKTEVGVRIRLGKLELTFLIPLDEATDAAAEFLETAIFKSRGQTH